MKLIHSAIAAEVETSRGLSESEIQARYSAVAQNIVERYDLDLAQNFVGSPALAFVHHHGTAAFESVRVFPYLAFAHSIDAASRQPDQSEGRIPILFVNEPAFDASAPAPERTERVTSFSMVEAGSIAMSSTVELKQVTIAGESKTAADVVQRVLGLQAETVTVTGDITAKEVPSDTVKSDLLPLFVEIQSPDQRFKAIHQNRLRSDANIATAHYFTGWRAITGFFADLVYAHERGINEVDAVAPGNATPSPLWQSYFLDKLTKQFDFSKTEYNEIRVLFASLRAYSHPVPPPAGTR